MKLLVGKGYKDFYFVDPNFIGPGKKGKQRIHKLMKFIKPLDITFGMETRPEDIDSEIMNSLVSSGFQSLLLGVESGSPSVLGKLEKHTTLTASENAIRLCREVGIEPQIGFLMFVPDSTVEDLRHNFEFLMKNNLLDRMERTANLLSHRQIVLKGTSGYKMFEKQNRLESAGFLGFEGEVTYFDKYVKWISDIVIHSCLLVLEYMENPKSPIYFRNNMNALIHDQINNYLVDLFDQLLVKNSSQFTSSYAEELTGTIELELKLILA